jgi:hypothetical protein
MLSKRGLTERYFLCTGLFGERQSRLFVRRMSTTNVNKECQKMSTKNETRRATRSLLFVLYSTVDRCIGFETEDSTLLARFQNNQQPFLFWRGWDQGGSRKRERGGRRALKFGLYNWIAVQFKRFFSAGKLFHFFHNEISLLQF